MKDIILQRLGCRPDQAERIEKNLKTLKEGIR